jgi:acyl dehydratase
MNRTKGSRIYFDDFDEGYNYSYRVPGLTVEQIKHFAARYDPQRFHLDEEAAASTHFGGLVASGFQTQLMCFEPFCREVLLNTGAVGAPGIDSLRWIRPWYPAEVLDVSVRLLGKRMSSTRNDRGYLNFVLEAAMDGQPTLKMEWNVIMLTREGAGMDK